MAKKPIQVDGGNGDPDLPMQCADTLTIKFKKSGTFCSSDPGAFDPALPDGHHFHKNAIWPDASEYPYGARPTRAGDTTYHFHKGLFKVKCKHPTDTTTMPSGDHVIHVGS